MVFDIINGLFETTGGFFVLLSVLKLRKEKKVKGVSWLTTGFFTAWGLWNLLYYPSIGQWVSFIGGVFLVAMNAVWLGMLIHYSRKEYHE